MAHYKKAIHFTKQQLQKTACASLNPWIYEPEPKSKSVIKIPNQRGQKIKGWIFMQLYAYCKANKLWLISELHFHPEREYRFDWAIMHSVTTGQLENKSWNKNSQVAAIEYEGLMSAKSGHTTVTGFTKDTNKYNDAILLGWPLIRITALNYKTLFTTLLPTVEQYFKTKK